MGDQKEVSGPVRPLAVREEGKPSFWYTVVYSLFVNFLEAAGHFRATVINGYHKEGKK
jgi:hypothetical protein